VKHSYILIIVLLAALCSCKSKPSEKEVMNCLLKQFDCGDNIRITQFEIENSQEGMAFMGQKQYEFIVSGEIEYTAGCQSFFQVIPAGTRQKVKDKHVFLVKMDKGWSCP